MANHKIVRFGVSIGESLLEKFDGLIDEKGYTTPVTNNGSFYRCTTVNYPSNMRDTVEVVVRVYFPQPRGKMSPQPIDLRTMISRRW